MYRLVHTFYQKYVLGTYFLPEVCTRYILFTSSMYLYVPGSTRSKMFDFEYVLEEKKYVPGTYFRVIKWYVQVCTEYIPVHPYFNVLVRHFSRFCTSVHILVFSEYILSCP